MRLSIFKGGNAMFLNTYPYHMICHWKFLLIRIIITFRKDFNDIPGQNGGLPKVYRFFYIDRPSFRSDFTYKSVRSVAPLVFFYIKT